MSTAFTRIMTLQATVDLTISSIAIGLDLNSAIDLEDETFMPRHILNYKNDLIYNHSQISFEMTKSNFDH